jgi:hypothetical protein
MPYWIFQDGETTGPMTALDVLWQAGPTALISDGEQWFRLDGPLDCDAGPAVEASPKRPERLVIRTSTG